MTYVFVGERPSPTALKRHWEWKDGRLAAKQLFDALEALGIEPERCEFANAFEVGHLSFIRQWALKGYVIIGMGKKAQARLREANIEHREMVHPAARGSIRLKANYFAHVAEVLS